MPFPKSRKQDLICSLPCDLPSPQATPTHGHVSRQGALAALVETARSILIPSQVKIADDEDGGEEEEGKDEMNERGLPSPPSDGRTIGASGALSSSFISSARGGVAVGGRTWLQLQWWQDQKKAREKRDWIKAQHERSNSTASEEVDPKSPLPLTAEEAAVLRHVASALSVLAQVNKRVQMSRIAVHGAQKQPPLSILLHTKTDA